MELNNLIVPTKNGSKNNKVVDLVYLPTFKELKNKYHFSQKDFVVNDETVTSGKYWLRNESFRYVANQPKLEIIDGSINNQTGNLDAIVYDDDFIDDKPFFFDGEKAKTPDEFYTGKSLGIRPCMRFDVNAYLALISNLQKKNDYSHSPYRVQNSQNNHMYLNFGEYPCQKLREIFTQDNLIKTGKDFYSRTSQYILNHNQDIYRNEEYLINGAKFVNLNSNLKIFAPVLPIKWRILNWKELPKTINPQGTGKATTIDLMSENILNEMPYQTAKNLLEFDNKWKQSFVRNFLNYKFLIEAFADEVKLIKDISWQKNKLGITSEKKTTLTINATLNVFKKSTLIKQM